MLYSKWPSNKDGQMYFCSVFVLWCYYIIVRFAKKPCQDFLQFSEHCKTTVWWREKSTTLFHTTHGNEQKNVRPSLLFERYGYNWWKMYFLRHSSFCLGIKYWYESAPFQQELNPIWHEKWSLFMRSHFSIHHDSSITCSHKVAKLFRFHECNDDIEATAIP